MLHVILLIGCRTNQCVTQVQLPRTNRSLFGQRGKYLLCLRYRFLNARLFLKKFFDVNLLRPTLGQQLLHVVCADDFDFVVGELLIESFFQFIPEFVDIVLERAFKVVAFIWLVSFDQLAERERRVLHTAQLRKINSLGWL